MNNARVTKQGRSTDKPTRTGKGKDKFPGLKPVACRDSSEVTALFSWRRLSPENQREILGSMRELISEQEEKELMESWRALSGIQQSDVMESLRAVVRKAVAEGSASSGGSPAGSTNP